MGWFSPFKIKGGGRAWAEHNGAASSRSDGWKSVQLHPIKKSRGDVDTKHIYYTRARWGRGVWVTWPVGNPISWGPLAGNPRWCSLTRGFIKESWLEGGHIQQNSIKNSNRQIHNWKRTHIYIYSSERVEYVLTGIHVYAIYMAIICNNTMPPFLFILYEFNSTQN